MGAVLLPVRTDEAQWYDFTTTLDGLTFTFEFEWNEREEAWYFNLYDATGDLLLAGKKLVADFPLLMRLADRRRPPGDLTVVDTAGAGAAPGLNDLGRRHALMYIEAADLG